MVAVSYFVHCDPLLQNATSILLQNASTFLLQHATSSLQNSYYKMHQYNLFYEFSTDAR